MLDVSCPGWIRGIGKEESRLLVPSAEADRMLLGYAPLDCLWAVGWMQQVSMQTIPRVYSAVYSMPSQCGAKAERRARGRVRISLGPTGFLFRKEIGPVRCECSLGRALTTVDT